MKLSLYLKWFVFFALTCLLTGNLNAQIQPAGTQASLVEWHYTIRPKDNIWTLGEAFLNSAHNWEDIIRHNKINDPKTLTSGTVLKIPVDWLKHQPEPAIAASVTGNTMVRRHLESHFSHLSKNSELRVGDEINTYDGSVLIRFADSSILRLAPNSQLVFNRLTRYGKTGMADTRLRLQKGRLSTHVTPLNGRGSRYEINTPSAVAAVRGTAFRLLVNDQSTQLEVTEGTVLFSNNARSLELDMGQGTILNSGTSRATIIDLPKALKPRSVISNTQQLPVTFSWRKQPNITTYYYQLFKDSDQGELLDSSFLATPEITLNHLTNGTYLVAMRAVDSQGFNGIDHHVSLVIGMIAKPATLLGPANNLFIDNDLPEFTWQYNSKNELSQLEIAKDFAFTELISTSEFAPDNTAIPTHELLPGEYYWRVKTLAGGESIAYSDIRRLKIRGMMPPATIISVNYIDNQAKIFWNTVPQAEHYILQLAEDLEFKKILHENTLEKSNVSIKLTKNKRYFARVKAVGNELFKSEFSTGKELIIK
ncbi:FecR family protein [Alkalimarinus alittae]|uniref:FecR domain-containing protein n=1 Tax=Alkalimarinus alittae TaxID=2961619 RepID=A0ABY6N5Z0_9ALTE|nr:FecR domain-containing protein [Alkalimarinus alittae]UZE97533.1 FecR domain-containing protein [Alkalimarinus alittae]